MQKEKKREQEATLLIRLAYKEREGNHKKRNKKKHYNLPTSQAFPASLHSDINEADHRPELLG